jgi:DNA-binding GntR family transcriptional regulator
VVKEMDTTPIDRRPARWTVYDRIRNWIEDGALAPGESIKDAEIAKTLGVSRTPVREALQMLEGENLVEMLPGRLTRVTDTTPDDIGLAYATLAALNALAAEMGTPRATDADVDKMRAENERLARAIGAKDPVEAREADRAFHGILLRLAQNPYLESAIEPLLSHIRRLEALYFRDEEPGLESVEEHGRIIEAVAAGDVAAASAATRSNFQRYATAKPETQPSA